MKIAVDHGVGNIHSRSMEMKIPAGKTNKIKVGRIFNLNVGRERLCSSGE